MYMTNKELGAAIRANIKKATSVNARQVSVKVSDSGYSTVVHVTVKDAAVNLAAVKTAASAFEEIDRDEVTGEILQGGNTYISAHYEHGVIETASTPYMDEAKEICNNGRGCVVVRGGLTVAVELDAWGNKYFLTFVNSRRSGRDRYTAEDIAAALYQYDKFGDIVA